MKNIYFILLILSGGGCKEFNPVIMELPYLGKHIEVSIVENNQLKDTIIHHSIVPFQLTNQYGALYGSKNLARKVYLTEFFFTSCPSVCPKVAKQMAKIHHIFKEEENFALVSFTLDPKNDTPQRLYKYANKHQGNNSNWYFLTGDKEQIYDLAESNYFVAAYDDNLKNEDSIMHDGVLVLVDHAGHVRGMYDGKEETIVDEIKQDINSLLQKYDQK